MDEQQVRSQMDEVIETVKADIGSVRTGRASSSIVEGIEVMAYGGAQKLKVMELASISTPDPNLIVIDPWDKSVIGDIRKGIESANVGLNPSIDGEVIRIVIPPMTTEDREKYVKLLNTKLENGKVMIRQIRGDAMRDIKNAFESKELSEDDKHSEEELLQKITDEYNSKIDELGEKKEAELRKV